VALWAQKAAKLNDPIVWDYHVILVLKPKIQEGGYATDCDSLAHQQSVVYDFDTALSMPCSWEGRSSESQSLHSLTNCSDYFSSSFLEGLPSQYQRCATMPFYSCTVRLTYTQQISGDTRRNVHEIFCVGSLSYGTYQFCLTNPSDSSRFDFILKLVKAEVSSSEGLHENSDKLPLDEEPRYRSPPPPYPPIRGQLAIDNGTDHNLMSHYVDMLHVDDSGAHGKVYGYEEVLAYFSVADHR
jgi:hypothetical protein